MGERGPGAATESAEGSSEAFCYGHPDSPTKLRCTRCDRPICGRCSIPASVGQHCPECVAEGRRSQRPVRTVLEATAPMVRAIIGITVGVYLLQVFVPPLTGRLGASPQDIADGELYRLFTAMFLHAPLFRARLALLHIFFNMYVLSIYGPQVEQGYGARRFIAIYALSGLLGSAASYAFGPCRALSVGASGALFGVLGALLVFLYNRRRSAFVAQYLRGIATLVAINLFFGFLMPFIDNFAHMGGLLAGALIGAGFDRGGKGASSGRQLATTLAVAAAGIALVAWRTSTFTC